MAQTLLTGLIVAISATYVAWALLLPSAAQRRIAQALLRWRWPAAAARRLQARSSSGCGCAGGDGCERGASRAAPSAVQPVHWVPRRWH